MVSFRCDEKLEDQKEYKEPQFNWLKNAVVFFV